MEAPAAAGGWRFAQACKKFVPRLSRGLKANPGTSVVRCAKLDSCQQRGHNVPAGKEGRLCGLIGLAAAVAFGMPTVHESLVEAALLLAAIFALTAIVLAVARRFRGRAAQDKLDRHQMMSNFRDLYDRGGLSDEEFRTIKSKLASELKAELNDNSGAG